MEATDDEMNRIFGAFYGHVIGDALGVRYEGTIAKLVQEDMSYQKNLKKNRTFEMNPCLPILGSDPPFIRPGQFTDDTEMALSLARSMIAKNGFDKIDVACAYAFWLCATKPKTTGRTTRNALRCDILKISGKRLTSNWREELSDDHKYTIYKQIMRNTNDLNKKSLSNGSLMRISPMAIVYRNLSTTDMRHWVKEDASITHANPIVGDAAGTYCVAIAALIKGKSKEEAFSEAFDSAETDIVREYLKDAETKPIPVKLHPPNADGSYSTTDGEKQYGGYLGVAFQSAFYELLHAQTFADGVEASIARGGDTDTNACIVAALLGARFGLGGIPQEWLDSVRDADACLLSYDNVRSSLDMGFLSIKDVTSLVPKLANLIKES